MMEQLPDNESQETIASWTLRVLGTYFFRLLGANLLFLIACIPVVTIPAAFCGLHAVIQGYYRNKHGNTVLRTFFAEFKDAFFKRTILTWLVVAVPILIVILVYGWLDSAICLVLSAIICIMLLVILSWFIPQLPLLNLSPLQAMKNALILMCIETKANFQLMAVHAISLTVMIYIWPMSAFLLLFLPVLNAVLVTGTVMPVLQGRLVQDDSEGTGAEK